MNRRGMTIIELMVASAILCSLLVVCLQMLAAVTAERRAVDQRQCATAELANVMERVAARPWTELTPEDVAHEQPSPTLRNLLPGVELKIEITPVTEPEGKRIAVSLRWNDRAGTLLPPLTITTWRYRDANILPSASARGTTGEGRIDAPATTH